MTYKKPETITYTQMAMWIDENSSKEDCDHNLLYEYLYHLCMMLSKQRQYFNRAHLHDRFCLYCATQYMMRILNKNCEDGIHYILSYIKKTLHFWKLRYQNESCGDTPESVQLVTLDNPVYLNSLIDNSDALGVIEFSVSLSTIDLIIKNYLKQIPKKKNSPEWVNIYISCLLTLIDSITLTREQKKLFSEDEATLCKVFEELRHSPPKLFHLDKSMEGYISVLVNELRRVISTELSWRSHTSYTADAVFNGAVLSSATEELDEY